MKKILKSLLLCMCLLTTNSYAEGEAQAASALSRFMASFIQGSSQFTMNSASFLYQVAINNPQATAVFVSLAASSSYGLYKIYNSEMMKKFREVMDDLAIIKRQLVVTKQDLLDQMDQVEENINGKIEANKVILDGLVKGQGNLADQSAGIEKKVDLVAGGVKQVSTQQKKDSKLLAVHKEILDGLVKGQEGLAGQSAGIEKKVDLVAGDIKEVSDQHKEDSELLKKNSEFLAVLNEKFDEQRDKLKEIWSAVVENQQLELPEVMKDNLQERFSNLQPTSDSKQKMVSIADIGIEQLMPRIQQMVVAQVAQQQQGIDNIGQNRTSSTLSGSQFTKIDLLDIVRQALAEQQEERSLNILLSSVDQMPDVMKGMLHLYKKADLLEKQLGLMMQLNCSMFQDMCYVAKENGQQLQLAFKDNKYLEMLASVPHPVYYGVSEPRGKKKQDLPLLCNGE